MLTCRLWGLGLPVRQRHPPRTLSLYGVRRLLDLAAGCRIHTTDFMYTRSPCLQDSSRRCKHTPRQAVKIVRVSAERLVRCGLGEYTNTGGADSVQVDEETDPGRI